VQELSEGDLERKHALREQLEKKFAAQDDAECTFKPQVNQYSSAVQSRIRITSDPGTYLQVLCCARHHSRCVILPSYFDTLDSASN
jgi:hypothetical protein